MHRSGRGDHDDGSSGIRESLGAKFRRYKTSEGMPVLDDDRLDLVQLKEEPMAKMPKANKELAVKELRDAGITWSQAPSAL